MERGHRHLDAQKRLDGELLPHGVSELAYLPRELAIPGALRHKKPVVEPVFARLIGHEPGESEFKLVAAELDAGCRAYNSELRPIPVHDGDIDGASTYLKDDDSRYAGHLRIAEHTLGGGYRLYQ